MTSCQCLTICKKLVFYLLKVYSFPKNYFNFWNILKKWHWFWPPPPLLKCHSYSHIQNLIFFWDPPPFCTMSLFLLIFFFEVFPKLKDPKIDPMSICSRTQKMTLWAYAQGPKKWTFERTLKDILEWSGTFYNPW